MLVDENRRGDEHDRIDNNDDAVRTAEVQPASLVSYNLELKLIYIMKAFKII